MNTIHLKTKIYLGDDALKTLQNIRSQRILIISDGFLVQNGMIENITKELDRTNRIWIFDKVKPDPPLGVITEAIKKFLWLDANYIIGFGGGSAIDTAKAVIYFLKESKKNLQKIKFIAIPTTSGTGSEVTSVSVVSDEEKHIKHVLMSEDILPDIAILDVGFTKSLPKSIIANTGMDVLTHSLEAYVSKGHNEYSDALSEKSGELLVKYLYPCYQDTQNILAKEKMHIASNLAGMAFNIAGLGINHSIAHQIGGYYHIPHGLSNAILLPVVIDYNAKDNKIKSRYAEYARKTGMVESSADDIFAIKVMKEYIYMMMTLMEMPKTLRECNVEKEEYYKKLSYFAENTIKDFCFAGNPREIGKEGVIEILQKIY